MSKSDAYLSVDQLLHVFYFILCYFYFDMPEWITLVVMHALCQSILTLLLFLSKRRMSSARAKAEQAQMAALKANSDAEKARIKAREYDPNFLQPGRSQFEDNLVLIVYVLVFLFCFGYSIIWNHNCRLGKSAAERLLVSLYIA